MGGGRRGRQAGGGEKAVSEGQDDVAEGGSVGMDGGLEREQKLKLHWMNALVEQKQVMEQERARASEELDRKLAFLRKALVQRHDQDLADRDALLAQRDLMLKDHASRHVQDREQLESLRQENVVLRSERDQLMYKLDAQTARLEDLRAQLQHQGQVVTEDRPARPPAGQQPNPTQGLVVEARNTSEAALAGQQPNSTPGPVVEARNTSEAALAGQQASSTQGLMVEARGAQPDASVAALLAEKADLKAELARRNEEAIAHKVAMDAHQHRAADVAELKAELGRRRDEFEAHKAALDVHQAEA